MSGVTAGNLCGQAAYTYKDLPKLVKTYASVAANGLVSAKPAQASAPAISKNNPHLAYTEAITFTFSPSALVASPQPPSLCFT